MGSVRNIQQVVMEIIRQIANDNGRCTEPISVSDDLRQTLGFDSLDLAVLVVRLEQELGVDPFRSRRQSIRTVGQLIAAYQTSLAESA